MSERGNVAAEAQDDAAVDAPSDHHLDEVAELIERAQADKGHSRQAVTGPGRPTPEGTTDRAGLPSRHMADMRQPDLDTLEAILDARGGHDPLSDTPVPQE